MKNKIVIDCAFGDCGKGLTVNNLCDDRSLVVRFSGGQQAGHTVIHNGKKHIFSSYGAGTLKGRPSFFTEDTTFYLPNILAEKEKLRQCGISDPELYLHPLSISTTPFDIAYNRAKEISQKHGSCGLGVGAAMARTIQTGYKLYAIDFLYPKILREKLENIYRYYRHKVDEEYGPFSEESQEFLSQSAERYDDFLDLANQKLPFEISSFSDIKLNFDNFVFEGSQGILLDMDHGVFPNVTFANTTSKNALKYCDGNTEIYYVTRSYLTRHGNGWMPSLALTNKKLHLVNTEHEINKTNQFQGCFRIGEFDYDLFNYAIEVDNIYSNGVIKNLVVTCVDQRPDFKLDYGKLGVDRFYSIIENGSPESGKFQKRPF